MSLSQLDVSQRLTIVEHIGDPSDGASLAGQNVNAFPAGALFYVRASNRFYNLRKNMDAAVVPVGNFNVVNGVGSSAVNGRFVANDQFSGVTLAGGTATISGFDLTRTGFFVVTYVTPGGTQGFLHAAKTAANIVTVTSSSGSDTSVVSVLYLEAPEEA